MQDMKGEYPRRGSKMESEEEEDKKLFSMVSRWYVVLGVVEPKGEIWGTGSVAWCTDVSWAWLTA